MITPMPGFLFVLRNNVLQLIVRFAILCKIVLFEHYHGGLTIWLDNITTWLYVVQQIAYMFYLTYIDYLQGVSSEDISKYNTFLSVSWLPKENVHAMPLWVPAKLDAADTVWQAFSLFIGSVLIVQLIDNKDSFIIFSNAVRFNIYNITPVFLKGVRRAWNVTYKYLRFVDTGRYT